MFSNHTLVWTTLSWSEASCHTFCCTYHCPRCQSVDAVLTIKLVIAERNCGPDCSVKASRPRRTKANHFLLDLSSVV